MGRDVVHTAVGIWDPETGKFAKVLIPRSEIEKAEEETGGKLVTDPDLIRGLHLAFIRHLYLKGKAPDVVRCTVEPLTDFFFRRVAIATPGGMEPTRTNLYFRKPRIIAS